jgi:8-oxo-dGTP pyrophosphatase MutT (NUDIX family)
VRWIVHGERSLYESDWMRLRLVDVEIPGGPRFEHHVMRVPAPAAGVVAHDPDRGVLMLWRHRFITDAWGWELPSGAADPGESLEACAARECLEETGWRPGRLRYLVDYAPAAGMTDHRFAVYLADGATHVGEPLDPGESERIEWVSVDRVREEVAAHRIGDGLSLTGLLWCFAFGLL